jgi:hypothetical protein
MKEERARLETLAPGALYEVTGGDALESAFGVMVGLAFIAGATGWGVPLAGAFAIGALLAMS